MDTAHGRVRLLLADDHPDIIEAVRDLLTPEFDIVATVSDGAGLLHAARQLHPDVIVTDIRMPGMSGIEASRRILELRLYEAIVALTIHKDPLFAEAALNAGDPWIRVEKSGRRRADPGRPDGAAWPGIRLRGNLLHLT